MCSFAVSRPRHFLLKVQAGSVLLAGAATPAAAQESDLSFSSFLPTLNISSNSIMLIIFMGAFAFAMWSATWLIRERRSLEEANSVLALEHADLKARHERAQALLDVPDQRIVIWPGDNQPPLCRGTLPANAGAPDDEAGFVAFGTWLTPQSAQSFQKAVDRLREGAESFDLTLESRNGSVLEAQGRASGSHAFVRFIALSGERAALASLEAQHTKMLQLTDTMQTLLQAVPFPVWLKSGEGRLDWVNTAYVDAVGGQSLDDVLDAGTELLDATERQQLAGRHGHDGTEAVVSDAGTEAGSRPSEVRLRLPATIFGDRRVMDISEVTSQSGTAGLAVDMSEVETVQANLRRTLESHAQTMNELATPVAIFDEKRQLIFRNQAFETLWELDVQMLDRQPENGALFDTLRDKGKIAEQPDWSKWRNSLLEIYAATEPMEHWWHLPDGRTLRVVANPHKQGGVTWVFENVTEQLKMESRYIEMTKVQGETLDHLVEAIAVFAPDGRLKLSNPSFQKLWSLTDEQVAADQPITVIAKLCRPSMMAPEVWDQLITGITGASDSRRSAEGRVELVGGAMVDYALVPLPNGQTMLSFADVSASVNLERTLVERNEALEAAERLKNEFIEHVSYEFRAPLTSIKGFAEVLQQKVFGDLNEKQAEYVADIASSSNELHGLVDNLLDLATVDAGIMELDLKPVRADEMLKTAAQSVADRARDRGVKMTLRNASQLADADPFVADEHRLQQVLFNLLANAITFSPVGGIVVLESATDGDDILFKVRDSGPGIPKDERATIFQRFKTGKSKGHGKRGAGLGLSIARALVELHEGSLILDPDVDDGACFVCRFPGKTLGQAQPQESELPDDSPAVEAAE